MHQEQRQQAIEYLEKRGIERALFANPYSITWLTGFAPPVQVGPNFFAGGPPLLWLEDGHFTLFVVDAYAADAAPFGREPDGTVVTYLGYTIEQPIDGTLRLTEMLRQTLAQSDNYGGKIGMEDRHVTAFLSTLWKSGRQGGGSLLKRIDKDARPAQATFIAIDGWLEPLRMVKTGEELTKLRENFALTDIGHAAARQAVAAGQREIDVWTAIHSAIHRAAGRRVPVGNDCVVGHRQANMGGWPLDYEIKASDSLIVDLSTVLHGYWSDSCATYYANKPTPQQIVMHRTVADALEFAASLLRPGAVAQEIDQKVRQFITKAGYPAYPHHTGHGVGVCGHEAPRLVPYSEEVLAEGMVIMLEPGIYLPGETGVRLEDGFLITGDGAKVLTNHDKGLP